ncbi:MAG: nuclear transport factor 2 family protein [Aestuariibacter sp.]
MHNNAQLLTRFYTAFQQLDAETMASCYANDVTFADPVFTHLQGQEAGDMWRMLCSQATQFSLTFSDIQADDESGSAHWQATYQFSKTGRTVHNKITANFEFQNGLIVRHTDDFDLWKWSRMALGPVGSVLGWSPFLQNKIRQMANHNLKRFMASNQAHEN